MATTGRVKKLIMRVSLWTVSAVLLVLIFLVASATWRAFQKEKAARAERSAVNAELTELNARDRELQAKINALGTPEGAEKVIRERFPLTKPGEEVIVLVDPKTKPVDSTPEVRKSVWQLFLNFFRW